MNIITMMYLCMRNGMNHLVVCKEVETYRILRMCRSSDVQELTEARVAYKYRAVESTFMTMMRNIGLVVMSTIVPTCSTHPFKS
eukprot:SAG11_NODE_4811_length_1758_cov_1.572634_4_plen_84_part_00